MTNKTEVTVPCQHVLPDGTTCGRETPMWVQVTDDWDGAFWTAGVTDDETGCGCELTQREEYAMEHWAIEDAQDNPPQE